jgi:hypothetical protein
LERLVHFAEAVLKDFAEAEQDGERDAAELEIVDQFFEVDAASGLLIGMDPEMAVLAHGKIAFAPAGNVVEFAGFGDAPTVGWFTDGRGIGGLDGSHSVSSVVGLEAGGK